MAIDRVVVTDDDGSGLTGDVFNNAWVQSVYDSIEDMPQCSAYHSTTQSVNHDTATALTFDSEDFDSDGMHSAGASPTRITIPANGGGLYLLIGQANFAADADGQRQLRLRKNGTTDLVIANQPVATATTATIMQIQTLAVLAAADYIELQAYHEAGAALNVGSATVSVANRLQVKRLV